MTLPKITTKQKEILQLLYCYRFLNRIQIQSLMNHKDYKTINVWLKDLREKEYIEWIYSTHFAEKTKPAIYYLSLNGIRYLKQLTTTEDGSVQSMYPAEELKKRYRESSRSQAYIDRCVLVASCCIALLARRTKTVRYYFQTEADYLQEASYYHFVSDSELIRPTLCFCKDTYDDQGKEQATLESYLLEVFDPGLPRYRLKKRLGDYIKYLDDEEYEWKEQTDTDKLPVLLFVCPRTTDLIYAKRRTRGLIADTWEHDDEDRPQVRFTTADKVRAQGFLSK